MSLIWNDVLEAVSRTLVEKTLNSTLPGPVPVGPQVVALVDPAIYVGALLIVGAGNTQEVVAVTAITAANFTATFAKNHQAGEVIKGATFPSGQTNQFVVASVQPGAAVAPLWTQTEMLGYARDVQNDLLGATRMIYAIAPQNLKQNLTIYSTPADSIRLERVALVDPSVQNNGTALWNVTQAELDLDNPAWEGYSGFPRQWYQDKLGTQLFAVTPPPPVGGLSVQQWYSQKGTTIPALTDHLIVPDVFWPGLKYGMLDKSWSKDGEAKDPRRAAYCAKRFTRFVQYGTRLMTALEVALNNNG